MKKSNKKEAERQIQEFFRNIESKTPVEIRKIKKLAMHYNIKLGKLKRQFCRKCFSSLKTARKRLNKGKLTVTCKKCNNIQRYKFK